VASLVFLAPASNNARLVFGSAAGSTPPPPKANIGADAGFAHDLPAGNGAGAGARLAVLRRLHANAGLAGQETLPANAQLQWSANVSRSNARHELAAHWQAGIYTGMGLRTHWQQAIARARACAARWQQADAISAAAATLWQETLCLRHAATSHWQEGMQRRAANLAAWQEGERLRASVRAHWQQGHPRRASLAARWQETLRLRSALAAHWQPATVRRAPLHAAWGPAQPAYIRLRTHWQEAVRPPAGVSAAAPAPPAVPPCYDPQQLGLLVFAASFAARARLVFICTRAGRQPAPGSGDAPFVIPALKVYVQVHHIEAVRLPQGDIIPLHAARISSDDEGFAWHLAASGPAHIAQRLAPAADGSPALVQVTIDGLQWIFACEPPAVERSFGAWRAHIAAASVTARLAAPHFAARQWGADVTLTARQIALHALQATGIDLLWQIPDWQVPPQAWQHTGDALSLIRAIAQAAGAALRSHPHLAQLQVAPLYPLPPWQWGAATPDVQLAAQAILSDSHQPQQARRCNSIWLAGESSGGILVHAKIAGSAGEMAAGQIADQFLTDSAPALGRATAGLAATHISARHTVTLPLLAPQGPGSAAFIRPGQLVEVAESDTSAWRALVRAVSIEVATPTVRQQLTLERA